MRYPLFSLLLFAVLHAAAQGQSYRILFLGNSYTTVNNLPQMVANVAASTGDTLLYDSNAPGGHRLKDHAGNTTSLNKIIAGNWDYVVLQDQSQFPSFPDSQVQADVYPYASFLDSLVNAYSTCAETVFYNTWGRKNGDADNCNSWPVVCTYQGMDSMLALRYGVMAADNNALLSPVNEVWKYLRNNYPGLELYDADGSHPSLAGTYAAACCFYTVLFRKDPTGISYISSLSATDAGNIRAAAKAVVFDSLAKWHVGEYDPKPAFAYTITTTKEITLINNSNAATSYLWQFGDGDTSTLPAPMHTYTDYGTYEITLTATRCGRQNTASQSITLTNPATGMNEGYDLHKFRLFPNPASTTLFLELNTIQKADYAILNSHGALIKKGIANAARNTIDISELTVGNYLLRVSADGIVTHKAFTRQK
ncbi:MAG TPA: PKD domain-containing protein [Chitinophagales bacterium]|nr:PKD domain-containing protein [Chitinophagales bacterium]